MPIKPTSSNLSILASDADPRLKQLHALLTRVEWRLRLREAARLAPWAVTVGLGVSILFTVLWRLVGQFSLLTLMSMSVGLVAAFLTAVLVYTMFRPRDLLATARHADRLLGLDERLSTALEDANKPPAQPTSGLLALRDAQLDDALHAMHNVQPERALPVKVAPRSLLPAGTLALLLLAVIFFPNLTSSHADTAAQAQVVAEQRNLEILKQAVESQPRAANDPTLQKLLQELDRLSHDLKDSSLTREQAIARLSDAESTLQKALDPNAQAQRESLDQLAKQLAASGNQDAKQAGDALKAGDPKKAADALDKAAQKTATMTPEERKALAQSLRQTRDSVAALDPDMASRLNDAAEALESGDAKAAEQALKNLSQKVGDTGQKLATQQQLQQALSQIQQSKTNIAQSGQATPVADASAGTPSSGAPPANGTAQPGTAIADNVASGTTVSGTPLSGTAVALGSPIVGTPVAAGSATSGKGAQVAVQGTPGNGTPVTVQGQQGQTGNQQGQGQGQGQGQNGSSGNQGSGQPSGGWGKGHQEPVYVPPSSVNAALTPVTVQGQPNPNGEQSSATTNTDANSTSPSLVPYEQVYGQYKEQAGNALNSDYIPQGYKDLVKDYFTNIAP